MKLISPAQLKRLQVLYGQHERQSFDTFGADARAARLQWASQQTGREISSFKKLTKSEAHKLINLLQRTLGVQPTRLAQRDRAQAAGTEGRRGTSGATVTLASADDLDRIQEALGRLGWDQARLEAWLRSPSSPLGRRSNPQIRTLSDANRVWWALKRLMQRAGVWAAKESNEVNADSQEIPF